MSTLCAKMALNTPSTEGATKCCTPTATRTAPRANIATPAPGLPARSATSAVRLAVTNQAGEIVCAECSGSLSDLLEYREDYPTAVCCGKPGILVQSEKRSVDTREVA